MKKQSLLFISVAWLAVGVRAQAEGQEVRVKVKGMVCAFCAQGLTKKFKAEEAVEKVEVNLDKKQVGLVLKEKRDLSDVEIATIIRDSGFNLDKIER